MTNTRLQLYTEYLKKLNCLSGLDLVLLTAKGEPVADFIRNSKHGILRKRRQESRLKFMEDMFRKIKSDKEYCGDESPVEVGAYCFQAMVINIDEKNYYLVIGPFYLRDRVVDMIEADLPNYGVENYLDAASLFRLIPKESERAVPSKKYEIAMGDVLVKEYDAREFNQMYSTSHIRYNAKLEKNIRSAISNGDMDFVKKCFDENHFMDTDHLLVTEPQLIRAKHGILSANSVYCRAAEDGGASSVLVRTICANYVEEIMQASTVSRLIGLRRQFALLYCKKVKDSKQNNYGLHVSRCINWMEENLMEELTLFKAAEYCGISYDYLSRLIKNECNCSFSELVHRTRCRFATYYLMTEDSIVRVSEKCGYKTSSQFCHAFKKIYGMTPGVWKAENQK